MFFVQPGARFFLVERPADDSVAAGTAESFPSCRPSSISAIGFNGGRFILPFLLLAGGSTAAAAVLVSGVTPVSASGVSPVSVSAHATPCSVSARASSEPVSSRATPESLSARSTSKSVSACSSFSTSSSLSDSSSDSTTNFFICDTCTTKFVAQLSDLPDHLVGPHVLMQYFFREPLLTLRLKN
ncbi:hypothetical protein OUZ56_018482 [Daphnia magna]|uniref:C2H2-type domain-containing protein n=1 Tax=Daphnia magna TaxID=35525 RepID=A0ABQ9Z8Z8_9CRUS|nr:hypothetical protein OUZ56_018482 [Daphnia magna]